MRTPKTNRLLKIALACVLSVSAVVSVGNVVGKSYKNNHFDNARWGRDLYQFWHGGRLFLQGVNPYTDLHRHPAPKDTLEADQYPRAARGLAEQKPWRVWLMPASAPLFILMTPLSLLTWVAANLTWFLLNIAFGVVYVWIILKYSGKKPASLDGLLLFSIFFSLICTRQVFELGQTSLAVAAFMWLSLAAVHRSRILSGILLGVAFSKFSVALPMVFYFVYKRRLSVLLWCGLVQVLGLVIICACTQTNWLALAQTYLGTSKLAFTMDQPLADPSGEAPWAMLSSIIDWVVTAATLLVVFRVWRQKVPKRLEGPAALTLLSIFSLWSLLVLFHNRHDMVIALPFIALVLLLYGARDSVSGNYYFSLTRGERVPIYAACALIFFVWIFPVYALTGMSLYRSLYTGCTLAAFVLSLRLFYCLQKTATDGHRFH